MDKFILKWWLGSRGAQAQKQADLNENEIALVKLALLHCKFLWASFDKKKCLEM